MSAHATLLFLALASLVAAAINAMAGGGTFITFPALTGIARLNVKAANITSIGAAGGGFLGMRLADRTLALGYGAALVLLFERPRARTILAALAPLGRMALTNYLAQSVIFGFVFYGYGLGQFGKMSITLAAALGVAVYGAQGVASTLWLKRYKLGPVEWLWRAATYGRSP